MSPCCNLESISPRPPHHCQHYMLQNLLIAYRAACIHSTQVFGQDPNHIDGVLMSNNVHIYAFEFNPADNAAAIKQIGNVIYFVDRF